MAEPLFHIALGYQMGGHLVFHPGPHLIAVDKRQGGTSAVRPGAVEQAAFLPKGVSGPLRIGVIPEARPEVVAEDGEQVTPDESVVHAAGRPQTKPTNPPMMPSDRQPVPYW